VIIVPALAVSRTGMRLGRGGGSYDRALARAGRAVKVALLHDGELRDDIPAEPHDQRVDAVITPAGGLTPTPDWTK
jgi:5-formyltetrahydrofolate cyclo-ligase